MDARASVPPDEELIRRVQEGDLGAFETLANRYRSKAYMVCYGYLRNREDCLDVLQEALLRSFRAIRRFDTSKSFYPWFYKILKNLCFSRIRTRYRRRHHSLDGRDPDDVPWELPDTTTNPETAVHRDELRSHLAQAMSELRPKDREIILLKHFQDQSYQEMADALGIPIGTVMSRLFHARARLRKTLEKYLGRP